MEYILNSSDAILDAIGTQCYDQTVQYKLLPYMIEEKVSEGYLVYNTLCRKIILLSEAEYQEYRQISANGDLSKFMINNWFYIPLDMEPKTVAYMQRQSYMSKYPRRRFAKINTYTIMTTYACNARCPYCYEVDYPQTTMSKQVTSDVADYILKTCTKQKIKFRWFGGEPLVNSQCINTICQRMQNENIQYESRIISNGYLFHKFSKEILIDLWHLKSVQITLDGTEENYNKIKGYVGIDNAYKQVLKNITYLLQLGIRVNIRLNVSQENYEDLNILVDQLYNLFHSYCPMFYVYSHPLFDGCGNPPLALTDDERNALYLKHLELQKKIHDLGMSPGYSVRGIITAHCMADNGRSVVINPVGDLSLCEHYANEDIVGNIYTSEMNRDIILKWQTHYPGNERCSTCSNYPQCNKLLYCPSGEKCNKEDQALEMYSLKQAMLDTYEKYKNNGDSLAKTQAITTAKINAMPDKYRKKLVEVAKGELGYSCKKNEVAKYVSYFLNNPSPTPWCMFFVQWCFCQAFGNDVGYRLLRVTVPYQKILRYSMRFFNQQATTNKPEIGYLMFIKIDGGWYNHIGFVIDVTDDTFTTIEGNLMDENKTGYVNTVTRKIADINKDIQFGIPKFEILTEIE